MSTAARIVVARAIVAVVLAVLVWRVVATLSVRGHAIAATAPSVQFERLTADFDTRIRWSLDDDAALFFALERHVPVDAMVMLYATEVPDLERTRDRMVLLQLRLQALRYPAEVPMGYGPFEHAAAYASLLQDGMWLVNVTPSTPVPLAEAFDVVERTAAFELSRCVSSRR
jgi:hypothetical protein